MATINKKITISVTAHSGLSEAAMASFWANLFQDIKRNVESMQYDSWRTELYTNFEESEKIDLNITVIPNE